MPSRSSKSSLSTKSFTSASSHFKDSAENDKHWKSSLYEELASKVTLTTDRSQDIHTISKLSKRKPSKSHITANKGTELSTAETPRTRRQHEIATAIATIGLLVVIGALLAAYFYTTGMKRKKVVTCVTEDCVAFGQELSAAINKAADPCHDFHAYVCGTWDDPNRQVSTEDQMRTAALNMAIREVREDKSHVGRAAQFFESCNRAATDTKENLRLFTELRASLGLTWPEHSTPDVKHPLDIMVDLALNWQMNFLFDITTTFVRGSPTLLVLRGRLDAVWEQDLRNPRTPEQYDIYLSDYFEILGVRRSRIHIKTADLVQIQNSIVEAKIDFLYDTPQQDWLRVGDLDDKTPTFSIGSWLNALAKHDKQFNWTRDSPVIVEDMKILETTARLLKDLTHENLVVALSWIFIQTHLWAVVGTPSLRFRGSSSEVQTMKEHGCMTYVESLLGLSVVAKLMSDRYGYLESRHHAVSFLGRMNENIKSLVNNLPWMDESSKQMAYSKLDRMSRVVMPHDSFFVRKEREALYSVFPDMKGRTFMTNLLGASKVYQRLRNHERFQDVYSVRTFPRFGRAFYLYSPNSMTLAIGDLNPPLFYYNATLAIRYGALGSIAGQQIAKTLDETGVTIDVDGVRGAWLKPTAAAVHAEKSDCDVRTTTDRSKWRPLRVFPAVAGLEVAYASFSAAVTRDYLAVEDFRILHLEQFTDKQIFFLAFCYSQCSKRPQTRGDECNVPAKNSHLFAEAFHCSSKSPMNPPEKCQFFEPS